MKTQTTPAYIPQIRLYREWLHARHGLHFDGYDALWRWSITDLDAFWQSIWDYNDLQSPTPRTAVLARNVMPGAQWFPGAQVNYAQQVLRHVDAADAAGRLAVIAGNERGARHELSWPALRRQVAALALHLRTRGVQRGDRVVAYLPNIPQAIIAFLATASIGAVWSMCAPDMGVSAVLDRFRQIAPKVLIAADGVHYAGRDFDRRDVLAELRVGLPSLEHLILVANLDPGATMSDSTDFASIITGHDADVAGFTPEWVPFDHPLWIVYSSGTTGLPKAIVHGHGGIMLIQRQLALCSDLGCSYDPNAWGERYLWYSSTGWMMWNIHISGLLGGTTCVIFDGSPSGHRDHPDFGLLWRFAAETGVTCFGIGAPFYANCMKAGLELRQCGDLSRIRSLSSGGSPLSAEVQEWGTQQFACLGHSNIWWNNGSGGTDFAGAFVGSCRELPQTPGVMQGRLLGAAIEAWNEQGQPVIDEVGELVCTQPLPSMPLYLWGDHDGQRYLSSYFDMYPPGHGRKPGGGNGPPEMGSVWRHGDWLRILPDGGCIIYGRSDATINRRGVRMGTSEIYNAVEALPEVLDSMVVSAHKIW